MKKLLSILLLLPILLMGGCKEQLPEYTLEVPTPAEGTTETAQTEATEPKEYREYATYPVDQPKGTIVGNNYYYGDSRVICYYDTELRRTVTLCSQPNCTHNDEKCIAYLGGGNRTHYEISENMVYAIVDDTDAGGKLLFVERNMITGENRILWDLSSGENMVRENVVFSICDDVAFLTFREFEKAWTADGTTYWEKNIRCYSYEISLVTGKQELLWEGEVPSFEGVSLNGGGIIPALCTKEYLLISDIVYEGVLPATAEEYLQTNPTGDYGEYVFEILPQIITQNLYSVNRKTGEQTQMDLSLIAQQDDTCMRDRKAVFTQDNIVCVYDGYTGKVASYFEEENIGLLSYLDGRVVYNVGELDENGETLYSYFWYDLQTGEKKQFQEGISIMVFAIRGETKDYFYGYCAGRNCFISKQDFYNENYDNVF